MPGAAPALSVVVAAWTDAASLERCLASLRRQVPPRELEVVVARNFDTGVEAALGQFPSVVDVRMPSSTTVPALRAAGLHRARGEVVAFLEDHAVCDPGWAEALYHAHGAPYAGVGGPVEQMAGATALDWAVYFYDYGRYMPPCHAGLVEQLSGLNMSFKRTALDDARSMLRDGVFEADLQAELRRLDRALYLVPEAVVTQCGRRKPGPALRQAYHLGRGYAGRRAVAFATSRRAAFGASALLLPARLGARIVAGVLRKRRRRVAFLVALPWLALLLAAWSAGEAMGYIAGPGGSVGEWR